MDGIATQCGMVRQAAGGGVDPESGLILSREFSEGTVIASDEVERTQNAVFACEITLPPSPRGHIYEQGGRGAGAYVGFRTTGDLVIRAWDGNPNTPSESTPNTAALVLPVGTVSGSGTMVFEINVAAKTVSLWWNGFFLGDSNPASEAGSVWAGVGSGGFIFSETNIEEPIKDPLSGASGVSNLRYYENQLVAR